MVRNGLIGWVEKASSKTWAVLVGVWFLSPRITDVMMLRKRVTCNSAAY